MPGASTVSSRISMAAGGQPHSTQTSTGRPESSVSCYTYTTYMAGQRHHDAGGSLRAALIAEINRIVRSLMEFPRPGPLGRRGHASTIQVLRDFLALFCDEGEIPWLRIYSSYPAWQQQSRLLVEDWNRDASLHRAKVFFTLITAQGRAINRTALGGGGTWKSTGADKIGNDLVLGKLYFKPDGANTPRARDGGVTAFEFHLPMDFQPRPRVAICVLHPTGYHHTVRDLRDYIQQGRFPGRYQANLQVVQHVPPIYQGPCVTGAGLDIPQVDYTSNLASNSGGWFMGGNQGNLQMEQPSEQMYPGTYDAGAGFLNGPHVDYPNNRASNSVRDILGANQVDQMAVQHEGQYLDPHAGFMNGLHVDYTINNTEGCFMGGNQANLVMEQSSEPIYTGPSVAGVGFMNGLHVDYTNNLASNSGSSGYRPLAEIQRNTLSNTYPTNDGMYYMSREANMFGGQHSHTDGMQIQRGNYNTSIGNTNIYADSVFQDTMANDNELSPLSFPFSCEDHSMPTAHDHTQDGYGIFSTHFNY